MTSEYQEILVRLARHHSGMEDVPGPTDDFFGNLRLEGDDAWEFLEDFEAATGADFRDLLWYFHFNGDEPPGVRRLLPILEDGSVAPFQPISRSDLLKAAEAGKWTWNYPSHTIRICYWHRLKMGGFFAASFAVALTFLWATGTLGWIH